MILIQFSAKKIYGYLDFDVRFNDRLSFLTGINGSGKTTVLNCVQALLFPDLSILQSLSYQAIKIHFSDEGDEAFIEAIQTDTDIVLRSNKVETEFSYARYVPDPMLPTSRQTEAEMEHYRDLMSTSTNHPLLSFIAALPTPMFLGLDRRAKLAADDRRPNLAYRPRFSPSRRSSRSFLSIGLNEAEDLVIDAYRDARLSSARVGEELQRQLILSLLTPSMDNFGDVSLPTDSEKRMLSRVRGDLDQFPGIFHLPPAEVNKKVKPFLDRLDEMLNSIPDNASFPPSLSKNNELPSYFSSLLNWSANKSQLKKIAVISQTVSSYNERRAAALRPFDMYKDLVNRFLIDSGKSIDIGEDGRSVCVKIKGIKVSKSLSALSSGEAQIFVILTNLSFGPTAKKANVFIIDEPELSLHLRWQEMFVDSVLSANSHTQFIMATHSPSIILERTYDCVDVIGKRSRASRA